MNRRTILRAFGTLAGGFLVSETLAGCGGGESNKRDNGTITRRQLESFRVTLSTSKTRFALGEPVPIVFTLTNTTDEIITLYEYEESPQIADFAVDTRILYISGEVDIWSTYYAEHPDETRLTGTFFESDCGVADAPCYDFLRSVVFAPGQSRQNAFRWLQNANGPAGVRDQVIPSRYRISVSAGGYKGQNGHIDYFSADPLEITIQ